MESKGIFLMAQVCSDSLISPRATQRKKDTSSLKRNREAQGKETDQQWLLRWGVFWIWPSDGDSNKCNTEEAWNQKSKWPWITAPSLWHEGICYVQWCGAFKDKLRGNVCGWSFETIGSTSRCGLFTHSHPWRQQTQGGKNAIVFIFF